MLLQNRSMLRMSTAEPKMIDDALAAFVQSPVMIIVGTRDPHYRPEIARAVGASVHPEGVIDLLVSEWQWPETIENLRAVPWIAVTFSRPTDYVTYQIKGSVRELRSPTSSEVEHALGYVAATRRELASLGIDPRVSEAWQCVRELVVVRVGADAVFHQTPGPQAGDRRNPGP